MKKRITAKERAAKYDLGGSVAPTAGLSIASQLLPQVGNLLNTLFNGQGHSTQPLINAQSAKNMFSPYAMGGTVPIEAEGGELIETPDGEVEEVEGATHEEGGVDMMVPEGTQIYSDRLEIEGQTMQERKAARERKLKKASKATEANPYDQLSKNSFNRLEETLNLEEEQDMALQEMARRIYAPPQEQEEEEEFAYGGFAGGDPWTDYLESLMKTAPVNTPFLPGQRNVGVPSTVSGTSNAGNISTPSPVVTGRTGANLGGINVPDLPDPNEGYSAASAMGIGDYIGLGANAFNAVAPLLNTLNAQAATKPEVNRFQGFGKDALEANAKAQDFAGLQASQAKRELDTATGSSMIRNRLGASSINTIRALDTVADINRNKAIGDINLGYTNQLASLLDRQGQLSNVRDQVTMSGATARDEREAQNTDNFYSNMAENLVNFGTNVGNVGRQLNISRANKDDVALLEAMSEYFDFGRKNGKLVLKNKTK